MEPAVDGLPLLDPDRAGTALRFGQAPEVGQGAAEFLARVVFDRMLEAIARGDLGPTAGDIESARVTLHESHVAWASYEGPVRR